LQSNQSGVVEVEAPALNDNLAVPFEAKAGERLQDQVRGAAQRARLVYVFDTE
jgi:hypothetical protein